MPKFRVKFERRTIRFPAWYLPAGFLLLYVSYLIYSR